MQLRISGFSRGIRNFDRIRGGGIIMRPFNRRPDARGSSGEYGMLQIMPGTGKHIAREMGYTEYDPEQLLDVRTNVQYAVYYLKTRPGDTWSKVSAYNAGTAWRDPMEHWYVQRVCRAYNRIREV